MSKTRRLCRHCLNAMTDGEYCAACLVERGQECPYCREIYIPYRIGQVTCATPQCSALRSEHRKRVRDQLERKPCPYCSDEFLPRRHDQVTCLRRPCRLKHHQELRQDSRRRVRPPLRSDDPAHVIERKLKLAEEVRKWRRRVSGGTEAA